MGGSDVGVALGVRDGFVPGAEAPGHARPRPGRAMTDVRGSLLPVLLPPGCDDGDALLHDLMGWGSTVAGLPSVGFVYAGNDALLRAGDKDAWSGDPSRVRAVAVANLVRLPHQWRDVRDDKDAVVAVMLEGPHAPARLLDGASIKEAARLLGAREVWLACTGPQRLEAVDAWRAPVAELGDALRGRIHSGTPVFVARNGRLTGILGPAGAMLPLPEPFPTHLGTDRSGRTRSRSASRPAWPIVVLLVLAGVAAAGLAMVHG
ncbi:MAG: hypothetical protein VX265_00190 [Myxococcota bacterium]|nr:hypothetical protein [Myxococcota bacterium]